MPQISQIAATWASQLFWLLLTFGIVYFFIGRGMATKVQATVDQRDQSVADDLAAAEAARVAADAAEETWRGHENAAREAAQKKLAEARSTAAQATEQQLSAAGGEMDAKVSEAEARITAASQAAQGEIEAVAAEAAQDIVARISGAQVSAAEAQAAVKVALNG
ncbi:ATPase [Sphingomonas turrisvirgatae]|uniref:ATP synthase subunit b n=1 Tax=Sphingomonas turrisvirgatae TaxID=1888892 RepID=A0A1E3LUS7_9SPHN|nr:ATPase [Sphingomonas turrisvirgatae]ODP36925.1 ATPase [Sphingomonas turrisvirgatae]